MTLNITVATERCIYQCADYRLTDLRTGTTNDFETQKIFFVSAYSWSASVCFAGVGRTAVLDVSQWLSERISGISPKDPFERLLGELLKADEWLASVPLQSRKHSFSVGAFIGSVPVYSLVSNFEEPSGLERENASGHLSLYQLRPSKPTTFVSGVKSSLSRAARRRLSAFAARDPKPDSMFSALFEANKDASSISRHISAACFTTYLRNTGEGGGRPNGTEDRQLKLPSLTLGLATDVVAEIVDKHFGAGRSRLSQFGVARSEPTDDYHQTQLNHKPNNPDTHSNFGAFLMDHKNDIEGAERAFRRAIELKSDHVNALGNLANLLAGRGDYAQAADLYRKAMRTPGPGHENVAWNFAHFLVSHFKDLPQAIHVLEQGIEANRESARLILHRAELLLEAGRAADALQGLTSAREKGADQASLECCYACALQVNGAPVGVCIAAYQAAISLNPMLGALRLNLAQLLFLNGEEHKATSMLRDAFKMGIENDAQLEGQIYFLCHTQVDPFEVAESTRALLKQGARLNWNVRPNIEMLRDRDPERAALAEVFSEVMKGHEDLTQLDRVLRRKSEVRFK